MCVVQCNCEEKNCRCRCGCGIMRVLFFAARACFGVDKWSLFKQSLLLLALFERSEILESGYGRA